MAPGGSDWLAQTPEETLEPEIPICDPHHHFWVSRPDPAHYQQYLLPELAADVNSGHTVRSTVFIEVHCQYRQDGPDEMKPVGEVEYIQTIADDSATLPEVRQPGTRWTDPLWRPIFEPRPKQQR
ncbi:MAG: hypothetical protein IIB31_04770 [Chloroflexi bacterium]|nr:hypothetical protein [Chloroflexota bacterium]